MGSYLVAMQPAEQPRDESDAFDSKYFYLMLGAVAVLVVLLKWLFPYG